MMPDRLTVIMALLWVDVCLSGAALYLAVS